MIEFVNTVDNTGSMGNMNFRSIVEKAILAPSADNLQPWLFKLNANQIDFFLDPDRIKNFCDEGCLVPYLSAGAAIENMRVAAAQFGYQFSTTYFPYSKNEMHVASIQFAETTPKNHPHFQTLGTRGTNRKFYRRNQIVTPETYSRLSQMVKDTGFDLRWIKNENGSYKKLAQILGEADQLRYEIERLHKELMEIIHFSNAGSKIKDGLDIQTLEAGFGGTFLLKLIRSWNVQKILNLIGVSRLFNIYTQLQMDSSQAAGFLVSETNQKMDYVRGGEIMEQLWHEITLLGLSIQPLEALPIFILNLNLTGGKNLNPKQKNKLYQLKSELYRLFNVNDQNGLLLLFRMGYAPPPSAKSSRRPVDDFLI